MKKTIRDYDLSGKKVIIRVDFNVPIKDGKITDENGSTLYNKDDLYNIRKVYFTSLAREKYDCIKNTADKLIIPAAFYGVAIIILYSHS